MEYHRKKRPVLFGGKNCVRYYGVYPRDSVVDSSRTPRRPRAVRHLESVHGVRDFPVITPYELRCANRPWREIGGC